jgi:hypothetical protein
VRAALRKYSVYVVDDFPERHKDNTGELTIVGVVNDSNPAHDHRFQVLAKVMIRVLDLLQGSALKLHLSQPDVRLLRIEVAA